MDKKSLRVINAQVVRTCLELILAHFILQEFVIALIFLISETDERIQNVSHVKEVLSSGFAFDLFGCTQDSGCLPIQISDTTLVYIEVRVIPAGFDTN